MLLQITQEIGQLGAPMPKGVFPLFNSPMAFLDRPMGHSVLTGVFYHPTGCSTTQWDGHPPNDILDHLSGH